MRGKWMFRWWVVLVAMSVGATAAKAAPFLDMLTSNRVKADPKKTYALEQKNGPWMIAACSFSGDGAEKQANELVYELRSRYKLPAYVYMHTFDLDEARGKCFNKNRVPMKARYTKYMNDPSQARQPKVTEIAVMVGNYSSPDSADAQATLKKLRYAEPEALKVQEGKTTHQNLSGLQYLQKQVYIKMGSEKQKLGPMRHALITTNPMLPPDYFNRPILDNELIAINDGVPYNLLECQGKYTVQVATFTGASVIEQRAVRDIEEGRQKMESQLAAAAKTADRLVKALRKKGYEAYQFHDRQSSIVTIGSFDSPGVMQPNGKMEWDPDIVKIMRVFGPKTEEEIRPEVRNFVEKVNFQDAALSKAFPLEKADGTQTGEFIPLDIQPHVVLIPKRSLTRAFRPTE